MISRDKAELCNIVLDYEETVSSKQCKLTLRDGKIYVSDLGGTNRTYLNNHILSKDTLIEDEDVLGFGRINLKVQIS